MGLLILQSLAFTAGAYLVYFTLLSAVRTFVLPRSENVLLTRLTFRAVFRVFFGWRARRAHSYEKRDRIMALFAPVTLLATPLVWVGLLTLGFTPMFWAAGVSSWREAFITSGSSLLTLGYARPDGLLAIVLTFVEATLGLGVVALLIAYLPTMYTAFSRRETAVTLLAVRAGTPASAVTLLQRAHRIRGLDALGQFWEDWELFFSDIEESHSSLAALNFFRSPRPDRHWVTASGAVLDAAALMRSAIDLPRDPRADLCIRAGYLALRHIADFFRIDHNPDPRYPDDDICVTEEEFNQAYDQLLESGLPMKPDRQQAWLDFAGWRVNYDTVLLTLAAITMAPYASWSSDRSPRAGALRSRLLNPTSGMA